MALYNPPKKQVSAGALFLNKVGEMLVVKPNYKEGWLIPGGSVEEHESPREACEREVLEEIGLTASIKSLLVIDAVGRQTNRLSGIQFTFYGGILNNQEIKTIVLQLTELSEFKFISFKNLNQIFEPRRVNRYNLCLEALKNKTIYYLENGKKLIK